MVALHDPSHKNNSSCNSVLKTCQDDRFLYSKPVTKIKLKRVIPSILFRYIILAIAALCSLTPDCKLDCPLVRISMLRIHAILY